MAEYAVTEVSEHRHEHYAVTEDGRPLAFSNNGEDARLVMFALAIADTAVKNDGWPDGMELVRQLREACGLFAGAMPVTPQRAWEEALETVRFMRDELERVRSINGQLTRQANRSERWAK